MRPLKNFLRLSSVFDIISLKGIKAYFSDFVSKLSLVSLEISVSEGSLKTGAALFIEKLFFFSYLT